MAKLAALPSTAIISGFKGVIDYYVHRGIPCVRRWPRSPGKKRSAEVEAQWPAFAYAAANWDALSQYVQDAYRTTAAESSLSGRDLFTKSFIRDYFREGQWDELMPPVQYLDDFLDVEVPSPADGQILTWEQGTGLWKAK